MKLISKLALLAFSGSLFLPAGFFLLGADSSYGSAFHGSWFPTYQKSVALVFLACGLMASYTGVRTFAKLVQGAVTTSWRGNLMIALELVVLFAAVGTGLCGAILLTYIFSGMP